MPNLDEYQGSMFNRLNNVSSVESHRPQRNTNLFQ